LLQQRGVAGGAAAVPQVVQPPPVTPKPLTPVNAALGQTIGRALDGRKTGIGIIGSVLTGLLGAMAPAAGAGGAASAGGLLGSLLPMAGVAVPFLQPIMLGLAAWGAIGKLDKWSAARPGAARP
jgi:peptidoglycan L-alanyl-D-glutamate endopeptidase CwlK